MTISQEEIARLQETGLSRAQLQALDGPGYVPVTSIEDMAEMRKAGMSINEIARASGKSDDQVKYLLGKEGVKMVPVKRIDLTQDEIDEMHRGGKSLADISSMVGRSVVARVNPFTKEQLTLMREMLEEGLPIKEIARLADRPLPVVRQNLAPTTLQDRIEMREAGMSIQEIADKTGYAYDTIQKNTYGTIQKNTSVTQEEIDAMREAGMTLTEISKAIGRSVRTIQRIKSNPVNRKRSHVYTREMLKMQAQDMSINDIARETGYSYYTVRKRLAGPARLLTDEQCKAFLEGKSDHKTFGVSYSILAENLEFYYFKNDS